jgi:hypothetical protein
VRCFLLDAETMPYLDTTAAASLGQVCGDLEPKHRAVAAAKSPVRALLERTGLASSRAVALPLRKRCSRCITLPTTDSACPGKPQ